MCVLFYLSPVKFLLTQSTVQISEQLASKFGKDFAMQARNNQNGAVDDRVSVLLLQPTN